MDSEKRKQKFWGYGFRFFSAECFLKFGEIRNSARRRGLGRNAGGFFLVPFSKKRTTQSFGGKIRSKEEKKRERLVYPEEYYMYAFCG